MDHALVISVMVLLASSTVLFCYTTLKWEGRSKTLNLMIRDLKKEILDLNDKVKQKEKSINTLQLKLSTAASDRSEFHGRVRELEDGIRTGTGISLRNEITKVDTPFTDSELELIHYNVFKSIKTDCKNVDDVKSTLSLLNKIQKVIGLINAAKPKEL